MHTSVHADLARCVLHQLQVCWWHASHRRGAQLMQHNSRAEGCEAELRTTVNGRPPEVTLHARGPPRTRALQTRLSV
jgi:hypothetical protein